MHLPIEKPAVHWVLGLALLIMVVLYAGVAPDVEQSKGMRWEKSAGFHYMSDQARGAMEENNNEHHPSSHP